MNNQPTKEQVAAAKDTIADLAREVLALVEREPYDKAPHVTVAALLQVAGLLARSVSRGRYRFGSLRSTFCGTSCSPQP